MGLKYVSAYLLAVMGGNEQPTAEDVAAIIKSIDGEVDMQLLEKLIQQMNSQMGQGMKSIEEIIATGRGKLELLQNTGAENGPNGPKPPGDLDDPNGQALKDVQEEPDSDFDDDADWMGDLF